MKNWSIFFYFDLTIPWTPFHLFIDYMVVIGLWKCVRLQESFEPCFFLSKVKNSFFSRKKTPYSHQGMSHILKSNQFGMIHFIIQDNFHEALQKKSPLCDQSEPVHLTDGMLLRTRSWFLKILAGFVSSCPESNTKKIHISFESYFAQCFKNHQNHMHLITY
ncbi:hypothetical protein BpHYR1_042515 [Brachionus plicatilis]|uniref:Uncharacterized protein n=1 Tax=Brachionus plicatilis TaxID=10195 RepID=A0A3M7PF61_BRAPC|nr:hypothetical protein BpHYR1_042515 [Brachionus plicatilis]